LCSWSATPPTPAAQKLPRQTWVKQARVCRDRAVQVQLPGPPSTHNGVQGRGPCALATFFPTQPGSRHSLPSTASGRSRSLGSRATPEDHPITHARKTPKPLSARPTSDTEAQPEARDAPCHTLRAIRDDHAGGPQHHTRRGDGHGFQRLRVSLQRHKKKATGTLPLSTSMSSKRQAQPLTNTKREPAARNNTDRQGAKGSTARYSM
jgi:hypothetical protein